MKLKLSCDRLRINLEQAKGSSGLGIVTAIVIALLLTVGSAGPATAARDSKERKCKHPHPCGYHWEGPAGRFEVLPMETVSVESHDGVQLAGFILRPDVPDGIPVPVILRVTPYVQAGSPPTTLEVGGLEGEDFVSVGYAVAQFSVRGTGDSGGCFSDKGTDEQQDLPVIIDWLSSQPWSNGRVGMQGYSYHGTTPVMAGIQNPPALKTIVIGGTILDSYQFYYTPQGAEFVAASVITPQLRAAVQYSLLPALDPQRLETTAQHYCPDVAYATSGVLARGEATGDRDAQFWTERRFIDRVPEITAATFVVHGFLDRYLSGHAFQEDHAWQTLISAPKQMLIGQFGHVWPHWEAPNTYPLAEEDWRGRLLTWFDYWLKGWGNEPASLDSVEFLDSSGAWHTATSWPPPLANTRSGRAKGRASAARAARRDEVVYLSAEKIQPEPGDEGSAFVSITPLWRGETTTVERWSTPCPDPSRLVYTTEPLKEPVVIAGNPFAWLNIESSAPGGVFELQLFDVGPGFNCSGPPTDVIAVSEGAIDLEYHESEDYQPRLFPVAEPTHVRVDLSNLGHVLQPEHRLALVVSRGLQRWGVARDFFPVITMLGDGSPESSHLILPIIAGTLGGAPPTLDYPPTPFLPECCRKDP
ncbi:MAG: CocE/NonD family hydrolase [Actinomycetota bacterium]